MKKMMLAALCAFIPFANVALGQSTLNSYQTVDVAAPADKVWNYIKDFDALPKWEPVFSSDMIISGESNVVGAVRTLTVKDGPSFDEELLAMDDATRSLTYKIIDPSVLPLTDYVSTLKVISTGEKTSAIIWNSTYVNKPDSKMKDADLIKFIDGVYRAGLDTVKARFKK